MIMRENEAYLMWKTVEQAKVARTENINSGCKIPIQSNPIGVY